MTMSPQVPAHDGPPPVRFAFGRWTWKEVAHLLSNLPMAIVGFVYTVLMTAIGVGLAVTVVGLPLLAAGLQGARLIGRAERARARKLLGVVVEEPSPRPGAARTTGSSPGCGPACATRSPGGRPCTRSYGCRGASSPSS